MQHFNPNWLLQTIHQLKGNFVPYIITQTVWFFMNARQCNSKSNIFNRQNKRCRDVTQNYVSIWKHGQRCNNSAPNVVKIIRANDVCNFLPVYDRKNKMARTVTVVGLPLPQRWPCRDLKKRHFQTWVRTFIFLYIPYYMTHFHIFTTDKCMFYAYSDSILF